MDNTDRPKKPEFLAVRDMADIPLAFCPCAAFIYQAFKPDGASFRVIRVESADKDIPATWLYEAGDDFARDTCYAVARVLDGSIAKANKAKMN